MQICGFAFTEKYKQQSFSAVLKQKAKMLLNNILWLAHLVIWTFDDFSRGNSPPHVVQFIE